MYPKNRKEFEIGGEDTPPCGQIDMGDLGRREGRSVPETGCLGLSEIECPARGLACQAYILQSVQRCKIFCRNCRTCASGRVKPGWGHSEVVTTPVSQRKLTPL